MTKILVLNNPSAALPSDGLISLSINPYLAFSIPLSSIIFYPLITIIILFILFYWYQSFRIQSSMIWPWGLIVIGAFSNLLDRLYYGGVVDFINLVTVFNVSDIYISVGVIWALWFSLNHKKLDYEDQ